MNLVRRLIPAALAVGALCLTLGIGRADDKKVNLKAGDPAPSFEAKDDTGKVWKSSDVIGKKPMVVFFFPAAFTGG